MPVEVILPKVDMDMTHGTVAVWHVGEGDEVVKGAALFDIETDKAAMEVESPATGRLLGVRARPGDKVAVGAVVALIYADGEDLGTAPAAVAEAPPIATAAEGLQPVEVILPKLDMDRSHSTPAIRQAADQGAVRATPAARATARKAAVAIADVPGTGPLGRVQRDDVAAWLDASTEATPLAAPSVWAAQTGPLHISTRKGTGTPLVLIHGFTADSQSWAPLEKFIGPARALIRIDLPGHGRSPLRRLTGFADLARMIVEAFDDVTGGFENVHLLGHSLGGALALAVADIRAHRVASLSLIAPAGLGPEIDAAALSGIVRARRAESLAPWLRRLTATPDGISDDYAKAAMKLRTDPALRAAQTAMADSLFPDGVQSFDLRPALSRLTTPACMIWGRQDHILPHRHALAADGEFAIHLLSGAGHVPQIECPDRVARILARHLAAAEIPV
jgi:pimeloyl-ACP methyl ester carboxylesterase